MENFIHQVASELNLKTVEDLMQTGTHIPFVNENLKMKSALKVISAKKLGVLIVKDKKGFNNWSSYRW